MVLPIKTADIEMTLSSMVAEMDKRQKEAPLYKQLLAAPEWAKNQEKLASDMFQIKMTQEAALIEIKGLSENINRHHYASIFLNYQFFDAHLTEVCTKLEGAACSGDKASYICAYYLEFLETGKKPDWDPFKEGCYWLPRVGTQDQWFALMKGLLHLFYGRPDAYFKAYKELVGDSLLQR